MDLAEYASRVGENLSSLMSGLDGKLLPGDIDWLRQAVWKQMEYEEEYKATH